MGRGRSTLVLFLLVVALGAYIFFVERKREPASDTGEPPRQKVLSVESGKIEELEVTSSGGDVTALKKEGDRWRIVAPIAAEADEGEVSGITSNLATLEVQRVVDENPKDLAPFGLDAPKARVALRAAGEKSPTRLLLGQKTPTGGDMYAKVEGQPRVFLVSGFLEGTFDRSTFDLRNKAILKVERDKVDSIEVRSSGGATLRFAKAGDAWAIAAPVQARADFGAVEGLLGRVASGQMKAVADPAPADLRKYGLDAPATTVVLGAGSARSTLLVGASSPEGQLYAKDDARPMVFTIDTVVVDDLKKGADEFRVKDLFEFRTFTGSRFELSRDATTIVFEKQKGKDDKAPEKWAQTSPKKDVDESRIIDFLSRVSNLRAESFAQALPAGAVQVAAARARHDDGKKEDVATFFKSGEEIYATRPGEPGAAKIGATEFADAMKLLDALK